MNLKSPEKSPPGIKLGGTTSLGHIDAGRLGIAVNSHLDVVAVVTAPRNGLMVAVGTMTSKQICLGEFTLFDTGFNPSVALNTADQVVVAFQISDDESVYRIGTRTDSGIDWCSSTSQHLALGVEPGIAINFAGQVVEVHRSENLPQLYYNVGNISGDKIKFLNPSALKYCSGRWPKVALDDNSQVVEVDLGISGTTGVWYHTGSISGGTIPGFELGPTEFAAGTDPDVGFNNNGEVAITYIDGNGVQKLLPAQFSTGGLKPGDELKLDDDMKHVSIGVGLGIADMGLLTVDQAGNASAIAAKFD